MKVWRQLALLSLLAGGCLLLPPFLLDAAGQNPPITTVQVTLPVNTTNPSPVSQASLQRVGNPGAQTYFYWFVAVYPVGKSAVAGPYTMLNAPGTLDGSNYVAAFPTLPAGATSIDELRTTTPIVPSGACNCAVATAQTSFPINDQSNSLNSYTVNPVDVTVLNLTLDNEVQGSGLSHLILRQNGTLVADLSASTGLGSVTSVNAAASSGLFSFSGGPITGAGILTLNVSGTSGGLPYFNGASTLATSALLVANRPVLGGGAGVAPFSGTVTGNTTQFATWSGATTANRCVHVDASGNLTVAAADCGAGGGGVSSVDGTAVGGILSVTGGPITTSGTLQINVAGTSGGIPYFSTLSTWASSGALGLNVPVLGGGPGGAPTSGTVTGNTTQFATWSGATTSGRCVQLDSNGNLTVAGAGCNTGGGGSTVAGTANQIVVTGTGPQVLSLASPLITPGNIQAPSGGTICLSTDTCLSRDSAGILDVGNGTPLDVSGGLQLASLKATTINATGGFQVNSVAIASANLSDSASLVRYNTPGTFLALQDLGSSFQVDGSSSGTALIAGPTAAGGITYQLPSLAGTFATTATSPLVLNATTGALTCPTCATGTIGANSGTAGAITYYPAAGGSTTVAASTRLIDDSNTLTYSGSTGLTLSGANGSLKLSGGGTVAIDCTEGSVPGGIAGHDTFWCDSTSHRWKMNNNNGGADFVVGAQSTDTLTNKTLTTPTIASFINATHNHQNAAGGGTLDLTLIGGVTILPSANGGTNNAFVSISGPASSAKTYTLANVNSTFGVVVASVNLTNQSAAIGATNLLASAPAGQYFVMMEIHQVAPLCSNVTAGNFKVNTTYTDTGGNETNAGATTAFTTSGVAKASTGFFINVASGNVQYNTQYTACTTGTGTYDLNLSLLRLF